MAEQFYNELDDQGRAAVADAYARVRAHMFLRSSLHVERVPAACARCRGPARCASEHLGTAVSPFPRP